MATGSGLPEGTIATLEYDGVEMKVGAEEYNEAREDRTGDKAQELIERFKEKEIRKEQPHEHWPLNTELNIQVSLWQRWLKLLTRLTKKEKLETNVLKLLFKKQLEKVGILAKLQAQAAHLRVRHYKGEQEIRDLLAAASDNERPSGGTSYSFDGPTAAETAAGAGSFGDISRSESDRQDPRGESAFGGGFRAKGGLIDKPKPKAKKMKQGGLASKK